MKNNILKGLLSLTLLAVALPVISQDFMNVYFKDGTYRTFNMKSVVEMSISQIDAEGVQHNNLSYQHITTDYGDCAYDIESIDSITFTKYKSEKVLETLTNSMVSIMPLLSDCESISDAENQLEAIKDAEGVEDAWSDGHELHVKYTDWKTISFHFNHIPSNPDVLNSMESLVSSKSKVSKKDVVVRDDSRRLKAVIANQIYRNEEDFFQSCVNISNRLNEDFNKCDFDSKVAIPTLDYLSSELFDNDLIFLITHGGYDETNDSHYLYTADQLGIVKKKKDGSVPDIKAEYNSAAFEILKKYEDAALDYVGISVLEEKRGDTDYWVFYLVVHEGFFENIVKKKFSNKSSIFFNNACLSLTHNKKLANIFLDKNLGTYLGYTQSNSVGHVGGLLFYEFMMNGESLEKSYQDIPQQYKTEFQYDELPSLLTIVQSPENKKGDYFLSPTTTIPKDAASLSQEYATNGSVLLEGVTSYNSIDQISTGYVNYDINTTIGFKFGTDDANLDQDIEAYQIPSVIIPPYSANDGKGNVRFGASVDNLSPGQTYYYRAYTYDGLHYNYGDICTFSIGEENSDERVELLSGTVGNAGYAIYKEIIDESDYHENPDGWKCYRSRFTLDITRNGTTNSYLVDDNIYLDKETQHHGGQVPCMLLDYDRNMMYIFCNSKDSQPYYSMDGNFYSSSINSVSFTKETVFEGANWGWHPYFRDSGTDEIHLCNFSYAGYFTILAIRDSSSHDWTLYYDNPEISPEDATKEWEQADHILVIGTPK